MRILSIASQNEAHRFFNQLLKYKSSHLNGSKEVIILNKVFQRKNVIKLVNFSLVFSSSDQRTDII